MRIDNYKPNCKVNKNLMVDTTVSIHSYEYNDNDIFRPIVDLFKIFHCYLIIDTEILVGYVFYS